MSAKLNSIAMCFSGGGYRAACFSFGALSLFEKVGLEGRIEAVSTVSGGTITGVKYAESQFRKKSFDEFFAEYYNYLKDDKLAERAVSHIGGSSIWKQPENIHKSRNPINAFAIEYNKFTNHTTLGELQEAISKEEMTLKRVIYNATDFSSGLQFRFQNVKGNRLRFGNKSAHTKYSHLIDQIKLGDVLASSSAFPGGFEPISFPNDYVSNAREDEPLGLMDGGIVDNQGSSVFIKSDPSKNPYDLIFISDVASNFMENFKFAKENKMTKLLSYFASIPLLLIAFALAILSAFQNWWILYAVMVVLVAIMGSLQLIFYVASRMIKKATGMKGGLKIPPRRFGLYLMDRMNSLMKMTSEVFLKNDRRQHAANVYKDYFGKIITATIYELKCDENGRPIEQNSWDKIKVHTGEISEKIKEVTTISAAFGTTLWFSEKERNNGTLDALIACGEFTACYNLITFLARFHKDDIEDDSTDNARLFKTLLVAWERFQKDPYALVNERKSISGI